MCPEGPMTIKIFTKISFIILLNIFIIFHLFSSCNNNENKEADNILIGVVGPLKTLKKITNYHKGLDIAVKEFNLAGGLDGKKIKLLPLDDESSVTKGISIATKFCNNG